MQRAVIELQFLQGYTPSSPGFDLCFSNIPSLSRCMLPWKLCAWYYFPHTYHLLIASSPFNLLEYCIPLARPFLFAHLAAGSVRRLSSPLIAGQLDSERDGSALWSRLGCLSEYCGTKPELGPSPCVVVRNFLFFLLLFVGARLRLDSLRYILPSSSELLLKKRYKKMLL